MPVFTYRALGPDGEAIEGRYTAADKGEILQMLHKNQYHIVAVNEAVGSRDLRELAIFQRVGVKDIAVFCRQFYAMLGSGVTIVQCLDILRQQTQKKAFQAVLDRVYESVQKGAPLSEALRRERAHFPSVLIHMVETGEASGNLDAIMDRMAVHFEKEHRLRNKLRTALIYPALLTVVTILVVVFLIVVVMPTFVGLFETSGAALPLPTRMLLNLSFALQRYWWLLGIGVIALIYLFRRYLASAAGRLRFDRALLRVPVVRDVVLKTATARFTRTLSVLLFSGMPLMQGLDVVSDVVGNKYISGSVQAAKEELRRGFSLAAPIRKMAIFPPMVHSMIAVGEESGTLDDVLEKTANYYDDEVDAALQRLIALFEPMMIIFMALVIGFIVIATLLPMIGMYALV